MSRRSVQVRKRKTSRLADADALGGLAIAGAVSFFVAALAPTDVGANATTGIDQTARVDLKSIVASVANDGPGRASVHSLPSLPGIAFDWETVRPALGATHAFNAPHHERFASLWNSGTLTANGAFETWLSVPPSLPAAEPVAPVVAPVARLETHRAVQQPSLFGSVALKASSPALRKTIGGSLSGADWEVSADC